MVSTEIHLSKIGNRQYNRVAGRNIDEGFELIKARISNLKIPGRWTVKPIEQTNWKAQRKFAAMGPMENPMRIRVKCKPSDNGSAWEFDIFPPNVNDNSHSGLQKIVDRLNQAEEDVFIDEPVSNPAEPESEVDDEDVLEAMTAPIPANGPPGVDPEALAATLSRLSTIIQSGRARKSEMKRVAEQLREAEEKLQTDVAVVARLRKQLHELQEAEANDKQLAEASQLLALAKDIKF